MDDERLHTSLQQCQDRLKTCLIVQYAKRTTSRLRDYWLRWLMIKVLTAIDLVAYRLLLCSRATHAKLLICYGYMMATKTNRT